VEGGLLGGVGHCIALNRYYHPVYQQHCMNAQAAAIHPALPPGFSDHPSPAPMAAAMAHAHDDADPGMLFWSGADGRCRAAVLLAPDRAIAPETLRHLGLVALHDALATLAPPQVPIRIVPPGAIFVDGASAAGVATQQADGQPPAWAIIGIDVAVAPRGGDPGHRPDETSLQDEGFGDTAAPDVLAQFCRHLLVWIDAWQESGAELLGRSVAAYSHAVRV